MCLPATAGRLGLAMGSNTCNKAEPRGGGVSLGRIPGWLFSSLWYGARCLFDEWVCCVNAGTPLKWLMDLKIHCSPNCGSCMADVMDNKTCS